MGLLDNGSISFRDASFYEQKRKIEEQLGREITRDEFIAKYYKLRGGA